MQEMCTLVFISLLNNWSGACPDSVACLWTLFPLLSWLVSVGVAIPSSAVTWGIRVGWYPVRDLTLLKDEEEEEMEEKGLRR